MNLNKSSVYDCWLNYRHLPDNFDKEYRSFCNCIMTKHRHPVINAAVEELKLAFTRFTGQSPEVVDSYPDSDCICGHIGRY